MPLPRNPRYKFMPVFSPHTSFSPTLHPTLHLVQQDEEDLHISPQALITTSKFGISFPRYPVFVFSILRTTSIPSKTFPKTTCLPSKKGVGTVVMKNWEPLPLGPAFCSACQNQYGGEKEGRDEDRIRGDEDGEDDLQP